MGVGMVGAGVGVVGAAAVCAKREGQGVVSDQ